MKSVFREVAGENPSHEEHGRRAALVIWLVIASMMLMFFTISAVLLAADIATAPVKWVTPVIVGLAVLLLAAAIAGSGGGYSGVGPEPGEEGFVPNFVMSQVPVDVWTTERVAFAVNRFLVSLTFFVTTQSPGRLDYSRLLLASVSMGLFVFGMTIDPKQSQESRERAGIIGTASLLLAILGQIFVTGRGVFSVITKGLSAFSFKAGASIGLSLASLGMAYLSVLRLS